MDWESLSESASGLLQVAKEVGNLLYVLWNQTYASHNLKALQELRLWLNEVCDSFMDWESLSESASGLLQQTDIAQTADEVRSLLQFLDRQVYTCHSVEALQKLRHMLTEMCSNFSKSLVTYRRKRSASTKDTPASKKMA